MTGVAGRLARSEILAMAPFDIASGEEFGPNAIKLDANENPFAPMVEGTLAAGINRYPEPRPDGLTRAMAALYGVEKANVVVTRGADDAIDMLVRAFCRPGQDAVAISTPTFSAYEHFARLQGADVVGIALDEGFEFNLENYVAAVRAAGNVKLAFICSPNNPTGNEVDPDAVLQVAHLLPETIVVLDEAYLEFGSVPSLAREAAKRGNLVVLKTLSKAFGLAGARIGCAIGEPDLISIASRALPPYPLPTLSIEAAVAALQPARRPLHQERIARIIGERDRMAPLLDRSALVKSVRKGGGNFLFLEVEDPATMAETLRKLGIRVRFRANAAPGGLRLTIGTEAENAAALAAFGIETATSLERRAEVVRDTKETKISVSVDLDQTGPRQIDTGVPFYDHMLDQIAAHGGFAATLKCDGDLDIDAHHSIEDCAIAFGTALSRALGDRRGIGRFGFALPMDEAQAQVLIDLSGRPFSKFEGDFEASHIGAYPTEMTRHVFRSLADSLGAAIHVTVEGDNDHHKTEACFKAFGRAMRQAVRREGSELPSTKGVL